MIDSANHTTATNTGPRLCVSQGVAQLLFLAGALEGEQECPETLLLYTREPTPKCRQAMERIARGLRDWEIHWTELPARRLPRRLPDRVAVMAAEAAEHWVCMPHGIVERALRAHTPRTPVVLYTDGLSTFAEHEYLQLRRPRASLRYLAGTADKFLGTRFQTGVSRSVLFFPRSLPLPRLLQRIPLRYVNAREIENVVTKAQQVVPAGAKLDAAVPGRTVLVLGQCFSQTGQIDAASEFEVYRHVIEQLNRKGYHVLWKDHPKLRSPFGHRLRASGLDITVVDDAHAVYPVELMLAGDVRACISATSSSLFTLQQLRNIPTYTFASDLATVLLGRDKEVAQLVARIVPDYGLIAPVESKPV